MNTSLTTIDEYIATQPKDIRPVLQKIRETIRAAAPDATEKVAYGMPTFWQKKNLVHFAAFKKHLSIFPEKEATEAFAERLKGYKTVKGGFHIPLGKPVDYELIADIMRWRLAHLS